MHQIKHLSFALLFLSIFCTNLALAGGPAVLPTPEDYSLPTPTTTLPAKNSWDFYASGGGGLSSITPDGTITGKDPTAITDYSSGSTTGASAVYGFSADYTRIHINGSALNLSVGLGYLGTSFPTINGSAITTLPTGASFSKPYAFNAQSNAFLCEQRLAFAKNAQWQPYLLTGFGLSLNTLKNYSGFNAIPSDAFFLSASPNTTHATSKTPFPDTTTTTFAYEVGIGLQHPFSETIALTADYRYINFGSGQFGALNSTKITGSPGVSSLSTNALMLSLKASIA